MKQKVKMDNYKTRYLREGIMGIKIKRLWSKGQVPEFNISD